MAELLTRRLVLRSIGKADESALHDFWNDPEVRRYLWDDKHVSRETVSEIVAASQRCFSDFGSGFYIIEMADKRGTLVGFCGHRRFENGEQIELLYGILPEYWGEGIVTEAATEVLRHGFEDCGLERVVAATDTPNQRSVRVLQRLGMVFQERREHHGLDTVFYSIDQNEFAEHHAH